MATRKRRLILSLSPELDQAIERLAKAHDRPRASVVTEILEEIAPNINALAEALELSKSAPEQAYQVLLSTLFNAMSQSAALGQSMLPRKDGRND